MTGPKRSGHRGARGVDDLVGRYLADIGQYPLLTAAEEIELAHAIEDGREAELRLAEEPDLKPAVPAALRRQVRAAGTATP